METRDQALIRLAQQARDRGIRIFTYPHTKEFYATSISQPGKLHRVTLLSCDCQGFFSHARCVHYAALLQHLGLLPDDPAPEPSPFAMTPLSTTPSIKTEVGDAGRRIAIARAEVVRLGRNPKSTADFRNFQNAQARLESLVTPYAACAA